MVACSSTHMAAVKVSSVRDGVLRVAVVVPPWLVGTVVFGLAPVTAEVVDVVPSWQVAYGIHTGLHKDRQPAACASAPAPVAASFGVVDFSVVTAAVEICSS